MNNTKSGFRLCESLRICNFNPARHWPGTQQGDNKSSGKYALIGFSPANPGSRNATIRGFSSPTPHAASSATELAVVRGAWAHYINTSVLVWLSIPCRTDLEPTLVEQLILIDRSVPVF